MTTDRQELKIIKCDRRMRDIAKKNWETVPGEFYIRDFLHADKSETQLKNRNAQRLFLPIDGDPKNRSAKLSHYTKVPSCKKRKKQAYKKLILKDVQRFKQMRGYLPSVAVDERQTPPRRRKPSPTYGLYIRSRI